MFRLNPNLFRAAVTALCFAGAVLAQQPAPMSHDAMSHDNDMAPAGLPKNFDEPIAFTPKALGKFTRPISSRNKEAQEYFDQGFQLMYAYGKMDAARSFREAEKRDPDCAICYWGEAWSWGSYLNGAMQKFEAPFAYAAAQKAKKLAPGHSTPVEADLIEAMTHRYVENFDPDKRREQDTAYAEEMRKLREKYPNDQDIATLYADSLFIMEPRRGSRDIDSPNVKRIQEVLESVLAVNLRHVGACHLYVHLTEATTKPKLAEACADGLGDLIPGASHLNHMPSHTYNQLGRWRDAVRSNIEAWHSDQKAALGEGFAIYPDHNLHMLLFAASMDGQGAIAIQAAKDYAKINGSNMMQMLTLVRFGRFDEVLEITKRPTEPIPGGIWDWAQGYARLRLGEKDMAQVYLARVLKTADESKEKFRGHAAKDILGTLGGILEGEIYRSNGDLNQAITSLERATALYNGLVYDEPEPLPFAAQHWLGAALLEAKRYPDAERVYREELKKHPQNGWSLFGLKAALDGQGKPSGEVATQFARSWARSEMWIQASRY
jgi:tetratricopeptide (TPR) repeat protein